MLLRAERNSLQLTIFLHRILQFFQTNFVLFSYHRIWYHIHYTAPLASESMFKFVQTCFTFQRLLQSRHQMVYDTRNIGLHGAIFSFPSITSSCIPYCNNVWWTVYVTHWASIQTPEAWYRPNHQKTEKCSIRSLDGGILIRDGHLNSHLFSNW